MSFRPRAIATDLDGTLLRHDHTVSDRTRQALMAARNAHLPIVWVTARPPRWIPALARALDFDGVVICGNGAFVVDAVTGSILTARPFPTPVFLRVCARLREALPGIALAAETTQGGVIESRYREASIGKVGSLQSPTDAFLAPTALVEEQPGIVVGKLLARYPELPEHEFLAVVTDAVGDDAHLAYSGAHGLAELAPPGVSKAVGLQAWCQERGITADQVWACGDMPNDIPMLTWAARGYAVANAHPEVVASASHRTASNEDDGVAQVIESALELPTQI